MTPAGMDLLDLTGRIFLITGVSAGLGRAFALGALQAGHTVAGTVRQARDAKAFRALEPERAHLYLLDVIYDCEVRVSSTMSSPRWGPSTC